MTTEIFVPKQVLLAHPKAMFSAVMDEVSKIETNSDTIYLSKYTTYGVCGVREYKSPYEQKIEQIEERKKPILDIDQSIDDIYRINNKTIITGRIGNTKFSRNVFIASIEKYSFDYKVNKTRKAYHLWYKITNKNKVEVSIYDTFPGKTWDYILTQKNKKWNIKPIKF